MTAGGGLPGELGKVWVSVVPSMAGAHAVFAKAAAEDAAQYKKLFVSGLDSLPREIQRVMEKAATEAAQTMAAVTGQKFREMLGSSGALKSAMSGLGTDLVAEAKRTVAAVQAEFLKLQEVMAASQRSLEATFANSGAGAAPLLAKHMALRNEILAQTRQLRAELKTELEGMSADASRVGFGFGSYSGGEAAAQARGIIEQQRQAIIREIELTNAAAQAAQRQLIEGLQRNAALTYSAAAQTAFDPQALTGVQAMRAMFDPAFARSVAAQQAQIIAARKAVADAAVEQDARIVAADRAAAAAAAQLSKEMEAARLQAARLGAVSQSAKSAAERMFSPGSPVIYGTGSVADFQRAGHQMFDPAFAQKMAAQAAAVKAAAAQVAQAESQALQQALQKAYGGAAMSSAGLDLYKQSFADFTKQSALQAAAAGEKSAAAYAAQFGSGLSNLLPHLLKEAGFGKIAPLFQREAVRTASMWHSAMQEEVAKLGPLDAAVGPQFMAKVQQNYAAKFADLGKTAGTAMKVGLVGAVAVGAEMMIKDIENIVNLAKTEVKEFAKVGKDAADNLMTTFTDVLHGKIPDVMASFNVLEEGFEAIWTAPQNVFNTFIENTIGHIPLIGHAFEGMVQNVESALNSVFPVFDEFKELGGKFMESLLDVGNQYIEMTRKVAGTAVDTDNIERYAGIVREIMASGAIVHFEDVADSIGRLSSNIQGLDLTQLKELTTVFAEAEELVGHIDERKFAGILNAWNIPAAEATATLTHLTNIARATGIDFNMMTDEMTRTGPAMRQLGYNAEQTGSIFAMMTQQGQRGTRLIFSMNKIVDNLNKLVVKGEFKDVASAWASLLDTIKQFGPNSAQALDLLGQYGTPNTASMLLEMIQKGMVTIPQLMQHIKGINDDLGDAVEETQDLGQAFQVVGQQISAALEPVGMYLGKALVGASGEVSKWLKQNQGKIAVWAAHFATTFLHVMGDVAQFIMHTLSTISPALEAIKDVAIKGVIEPIMTAMEGIAEPLSHLPGRFGKPFRDFIDAADKAKHSLDTAYNFDISKAMGDATAKVDGFVNGTLPQLEHGMNSAADSFARTNQVANAFSETIGGKVTDAFQVLRDASGGVGSAENPAMMLLGTKDQWEEVKTRLRALGIDLQTNAGGMITGVNFLGNDDQKKEAKKAWDTFWDEEIAEPNKNKPLPLAVQPQVDGNDVNSASDMFQDPGSAVPVQVIPITPGGASIDLGGAPAASGTLPQFTGAPDLPAAPASPTAPAPPAAPGHALGGSVGSDGWVRGHWSPGVDTVPATVPVGSYVIRRSQAQRHATFLDNIAASTSASGPMMPVMLEVGEKVMPPMPGYRRLFDAVNRGLRGFSGGGSPDGDTSDVPGQILLGLVRGLAKGIGLDLPKNKPQTLQTMLLPYGPALTSPYTTSAISAYGTSPYSSAAGTVTIPAGDAQQQAYSAMIQAGGQPSDWQALSYIISKEDASWTTDNANMSDSNAAAGNPSVGLGQLTLSNYRAAGLNVNSVSDASALSPFQQVTAMMSYIKGRYGSVQNAYHHWLASHNYAAGGAIGFDSGGEIPEGPEYYGRAYANNRRFAVPSNSDYQTHLTTAQEQAFTDWLRDSGAGRYFDPVSGRTDYDMRGFWLATKGAGWRPGLHFPDRWKTPYDTTFSNESMYALPGAPHWQGDTLIGPDGPVRYSAGGLADGGPLDPNMPGSRPGLGPGKADWWRQVWDDGIYRIIKKHFGRIKHPGQGPDTGPDAPLPFIPRKHARGVRGYVGSQRNGGPIFGYGTGGHVDQYGIDTEGAQVETIAIADALAQMYPGATQHLYSAPDGYDEHSSGEADDFMVFGDTARGYAVKDWALKQPGVMYAIWQQKMWYPGGRVEQMPDRGSPTKNHMDHVHIRTHGGGYPPGGGPGPQGAVSRGKGWPAGTSATPAAGTVTVSAGLPDASGPGLAQVNPGLLAPGNYPITPMPTGAQGPLGPFNPFGGLVPPGVSPYGMQQWGARTIEWQNQQNTLVATIRDTNSKLERNTAMLQQVLPIYNAWKAIWDKDLATGQAAKFDENSRKALNAAANQMNALLSERQTLMTTQQGDQARLQELQLQGPPLPEQSDKYMTMSQQLGAGFIKGLFQELGFPDVFGKAFTNMGIWKLGMGIAGFGLKLWEARQAGTGEAHLGSGLPPGPPGPSGEPQLGPSDVGIPLPPGYGTPTPGGVPPAPASTPGGGAYTGPIPKSVQDQPGWTPPPLPSWADGYEIDKHGNMVAHRKPPPTPSPPPPAPPQPNLPGESAPSVVPVLPGAPAPGPSGQADNPFTIPAAPNPNDKGLPLADSGVASSLFGGGGGFTASLARGLARLTTPVPALKPSVGAPSLARFLPKVMPRFATGGPSGTDTIPAWLSPGEFVVNAQSARRWLPQLQFMNDGHFVPAADPRLGIGDRGNPFDPAIPPDHAEYPMPAQGTRPDYSSPGDGPSRFPTPPPRDHQWVPGSPRNRDAIEAVVQRLGNLGLRFIKAQHFDGGGPVAPKPGIPYVPGLTDAGPPRAPTLPDPGVIYVPGLTTPEPDLPDLPLPGSMPKTPPGFIATGPGPVLHGGSSIAPIDMPWDVSAPAKPGSQTELRQSIQPWLDLGRRAVQPMLDYFRGSRDAAGNFLGGTFQLITHPLDTLPSMAPLVGLNSHESIPGLVGLGADGSPGVLQSWENHYENLLQSWKGVGKSVVHWDDWNTNPSYAAGGASFDIGSLLLMRGRVPDSAFPKVMASDGYTVRPMSLAELQRLEMRKAFPWGQIRRNVEDNHQKRIPSLQDLNRDRSINNKPPITLGQYWDLSQRAIGGTKTWAEMPAQVREILEREARKPDGWTEGGQEYVPPLTQAILNGVENVGRLPDLVPQQARLAALNAAPYVPGLTSEPGYSAGGPVFGPGGPISDMVHANLSNGEFVMNANATKYYGPGTLSAMNSMQLPNSAAALAGAMRPASAPEPPRSSPSGPAMLFTQNNSGIMTGEQVGELAQSATLAMSRHTMSAVSPALVG